ncbi:unnamed protein product [Schistosoma spindalis]|nr:unnamed protein product [Schistosoma spindale]
MSDSKFFAKRAVMTSKNGELTYLGHSHVAGLLYIADIRVDFTVDSHCQNTSTKHTGHLCISSIAKKYAYRAQ